MGPFVYETERPHLNEAALLAGTNPELDAAEAAQQRRGRAPDRIPRDAVLQRAIDLVTSLAIYQKRKVSPLEKRIGHKFRNPLLLAEALTHPELAPRDATPEIR